MGVGVFTIVNENLSAVTQAEIMFTAEVRLANSLGSYQYHLHNIQHAMIIIIIISITLAKWVLTGLVEHMRDRGLSLVLPCHEVLSILEMAHQYLLSL